MLVIFNHTKLNADQIEALNKININKITYLPDELSLKWSNIDPEKEIIDLSEFKEFIINNTDVDEIVLIQGDFGAAFQLVNFCLERDRIPVYATTRRTAEEKMNPDGSVEKISKFKFVKFRKYLK